MIFKKNPQIIWLIKKFIFDNYTRKIYSRLTFFTRLILFFICIYALTEIRSPTLCINHSLFFIFHFE